MEKPCLLLFIFIRAKIAVCNLVLFSRTYMLNPVCPKKALVFTTIRELVVIQLIWAIRAKSALLSERYILFLSICCKASSNSLITRLLRSYFQRGKKVNMFIDHLAALLSNELLRAHRHRSHSQMCLDA